ncbi:MAG: hypothetical protein IH910_10090 [Proteobacteria bacterium]|nr:hypothetical protein [Pseudomonadota bacterium]
MLDQLKRYLDMGLISHFHRAYNLFRRPTAYILMALAIAGQFLNVGILPSAALLALGIIVLELLFDLHKTLQSQTPTTTLFNDFYDASRAMTIEINRVLDLKNKITICALGMSMGHGWSFLRGTLEPLLHNGRNVEVELNIAMLDPSWHEIDKLNPSWKDRAGANLAEINRFITDSRELMDRYSWSINIHTYRHMPNWHGVCINNDKLFLSHCYWKRGYLTGAENIYERINRDDGAHESSRVSHFMSWFERAFNET